MLCRNPQPGIWMLGAPVLRLAEKVYTRRYLQALPRASH
jgi:hypothetical protein